MKTGTVRVAAVGLAVILAGVASAQADRELVVGIKSAPPFVIEQEDGRWSGLSVELWMRVAQELGLAYRYERRDLAGLLDGLEDRSLDVAVGALTLSDEREKRFDFSHSYYAGGLGIAVAAGVEHSVIDAIRAFVSADFVAALGALLLVLFGAGALLWAFERRRNPEQFGGTPLEGLGSGMWWSAVTMTTVGYGDKAPVTLGGRMVALVWMFASVITISSFTAAIATTLTISSLGGASLASRDDLAGARVATVSQSTSESWLRNHGIGATGYDDLRAALDAVIAGEMDGVVYDVAILRYLATTEYAGRVAVLADEFERQGYALGLPEGSEIEEPLDQALLGVVERKDWAELLIRYFGQ